MDELCSGINQRVFKFMKQKIREITGESSEIIKYTTNFKFPAGFPN